VGGLLTYLLVPMKLRNQRDFGLGVKLKWDWIPAFAGMSGFVGLCSQTVGVIINSNNKSVRLLNPDGTCV